MGIERGLVRTRYGHIHYRAAGQGRPVLLFHINQQSSALYLELMAELAPLRRAIAIDYPSHGHSDHLATQPSIEDYARCGLEVLDALGLDRAAVLGEAVGAAVSTAFASLFPDRVEKAILLNCPYYPDRATADRSHAPLKSGLRPGDATGFPVTRSIEFLLGQDPAHAPMNPTQSWMDRVNVAQIEAGRDRWQALDALHEYDICGNLARITCPVMLLIGEHFHYLKFRQEFERVLRDGRVHVIEGARFCMGWERAAEVGRMALAFLR